MDNNIVADGLERKPTSNKQVDNPPVWGSCRLVVMVCCFLSMVTNFSGQTIMTSAMVCMISSRSNDVINSTVNVTSVTHGNAWKHSWDSKTQNLILSSFFILYYLGQLPSGMLAQRVPNRKLVIIGQAMSGILQLMAVPASLWGVPWLMAMRLLGGMVSSLVYPNTMAMLANWTPRHEISVVFGTVGIGMEAGNLLSFGVSIFACQIDFQGGWPFVFYCQGGIQLIVVALFVFCTYDNPMSHSSISQEEKVYLISSTIQRGNKAKTPVRAIVTSLPVIALSVCKLVSSCSYFLFVINVPQYARDALKLSPLEISIVMTLPYLVIFPSIVGLGKLADYIVLKGIASNTTVRKSMDIGTKLLYSVLIVALGYVPEKSWPLVFVINVGIVFSLGMGYLSYEANPADLSPAHTGFICSVVMALSYWVTFVLPIVVGIITQDTSRESWQLVFYMMVAIQVTGLGFFLMFGSGELQPWAHHQQGDEDHQEIPCGTTIDDKNKQRECAVDFVNDEDGSSASCGYRSSSKFSGNHHHPVSLSPSLSTRLVGESPHEKTQLISRHK